jgi:hypothetical protein
MEIQERQEEKVFKTKRLNKPIYIVDIESDGLLDEVSKIHCLSYGQIVNDQFWVKTITDYEDIKKFVSRRDITIVGHNFISYDNLVLEKILGAKFEHEQLIDSLYLSWALYPKLLKHGLEEWGNTLGVKKPIISDWKNPTSEDIKHRCESDVKINLLLWQQQFEYLTAIYEGDFEHYIDFLMLIAEIVVYQEQNPCRYDVKAANELLDKLETEKEQRIANLKKVMPKVQKKTTKTIKSVIKISDDEYYQKGDLMYEHYLRLNYPIIDHKITKIIGEELPNPNSVPQKKAWLYSLGWVPTTFKKVKEKDGSKRAVEQIMSEEGDGSLCTSVQALFDIEPGLKELEGLSILTHRIGVVKGLNRDQRNGYIQASISGLTQTLRLKHKFLVNMPKPSKAYGKEIRGLIIAENDGLLIGTDLANIESRTKNHYIYDYDPEYVNEMSDPLFDSHLDTALQGELISKEDLLFYTWYNLTDKSKYDTSLIEDYITLDENIQKKEISRIKNQRQVGKGVNFSCQYGAGPATIAEQNKIPLKVAKKLHKAYHDRNKSVQQFANSLTVKTVNGQKWILNPIFNMWYFLKADKDKFSAINQGTASALFMQWLKNCRDLGVFCRFNVHDEQIIYTDNNRVEEDKSNIKKAMDILNETYQLNVTLNCSIDVGKSYSEIH